MINGDSLAQDTAVRQDFGGKVAMEKCVFYSATTLIFACSQWRNETLKPIRILGAFAGTFLLLGVLLNLFTAVYAANITVNSNLDTADINLGDSVCDADAGTLGNQCTLRAAIQNAHNAAGADTISFASNMDINLTGSLPALSEEGLSIVAASGQKVRINGQSLVNNVFRITGSYVTISNVVVYGSGSLFSNIWVDNAARGVIIANNLIGDNDPAPGGCGQSDNSYGGIYVSSSSPAPTDTYRVWIYGNTIECHTSATGHGITLAATNRVFIGQNLEDAASQVDGNVIRENKTGIAVDGGEMHFISSNVIQNNTGDGIFANNGVEDFVVGCGSLSAPDPASCRNRIRGNGSAGVHLAGNTTTISGIAYNWIGLADDGVTAVPNQYGVYLDTDNNRTLLVNNTISGNTEDGVRIRDTTGNQGLWGNVIGLGADGVTAVPNGSHGVAFFDNTGTHVIGGDQPEHTNTISGNAGYGILVSNSPSVTIQLNLIGLAQNESTIRGNGYEGIYVSSSDGVEIGNVIDEELYGSQKIVGNGDGGIYFDNVNDSIIGPGNDVTDNGGAGIYVFNSQRNKIIPQWVSRNANEGVRLSGNAAIHNQIYPLRVWGNGRLPIDFGAPGLEPNDLNDTDNGPNHLLNYPEVTLTSGTVVTGTACANCVILAYQVQGDPTENGGGGIYRAFTASNASGIWSIDLATAGLNLFPVSFVAISGPLSSSTVDSSPMSPVTQVGYGNFLPMVVR